MDKLSKDETDNRGKYKQYTERDRLAIARHAEQNRPGRTARKFDKQYPNLNESTARSFLKKVHSHGKPWKEKLNITNQGYPSKKKRQTINARNS